MSPAVLSWTSLGFGVAAMLLYCAVLATRPNSTPEEIDGLVAARLTRQVVLDREDPPAPPFAAKDWQRFADRVRAGR